MPNPDLLAYIRQLAPELDEAQAEAIASALPATRHDRGTVLVRQGEVAIDCYFVLRGCLRQSFVDSEGNDRTVDFISEQQSLTIFESYKEGRPSPYSVECVEDVLLLEGDLANEQAMNDKFPFLKDITRTAMENALASGQQDRTWFKTLAPEDRYLYVLEHRPGLAGRVPQHQLASYLGVTPESLSRIKKRLHDAATA